MTEIQRAAPPVAAEPRPRAAETAEGGVRLHIAVEPARAVILLDGVPIGRSPVTAALWGDGEHLVTALPVCTRADQAFYGITRALTFSGGALSSGAPDAKVFDWGGGVWEAELRLPPLPTARPRVFPYTLAQLQWERQLAVLYYDDGLWLSVETGARVLAGFALSGAASGELSIRNRCLFAVTRGGSGEEALVLAPNRSVLLNVRADRILLEDGQVAAIDRLPTQRGYERRTRYRLVDGVFAAEPPETGFFTHAPGPVTDPVRALLESLLAGDASGAADYLSPSLREGLDAAALSDFLGPFTGVRPFFLEPDVLGLTRAPIGDAIPCRRFRFLLDDDGRIDNIEEAEIGGEM